MKTLRSLPQEILKLIACVTMLIDHVGAVFFPGILWIRMIGRIAFPIYCFLLAEGIRHTQDPRKYLLRLVIGIFLAELPFDYLFFGSFTMESQSVMVTLTLGAFMLLCMTTIQAPTIKALLAIPFVIIAEVCCCDYGGYGILLIALFGLTEIGPVQLGLLVVLNLAKDAHYIYDKLPAYHAAGWPTIAAIKRILLNRPPIQSLCITAMLPIYLYGGQKLTRSKVLQTGFYLFYPVHLAVLWILSNYLL